MKTRKDTSRKIRGQSNKKFGKCQGNKLQETTGKQALKK